MVKVFTLNERNKIEFTKEELETLLNEAWHDGYNSNHYCWWTSPSVTLPNVITTDHTITCEYGNGQEV